MLSPLTTIRRNWDRRPASISAMIARAHGIHERRGRVAVGRAGVDSLGLTERETRTDW